MLTHIHIRELITIQYLELELLSGSNAITGETGAGKSILIDAIEIALGARVSGNLVRDGATKAEISLTFDVKNLPRAREWLQSYELDNEDAECIVRRIITSDGRSKSFINGMPTTLQPLRELSELLLAIHGQHEYLTLLKQEAQRDKLDIYANHSHLIDNVREHAKEWHSLNSEIEKIKTQTKERQARLEYLSFQHQELETLQLTPDEFLNLDLEHKQLAHADELLKSLTITLDILGRDEKNNISYLLNHTIHALESIEKIDPKIQQWVNNLKSINIQMSDVESEIERYFNSVDLDPNRLAWIEERLSALFNIARKHKISPNELFEFQNNLTQEIKALESKDELINEHTKKLSDIETTYLKYANELTASRKIAAQKLEKEINVLIKKLALPHGEFSIAFESDASFLPLHGLEKINFLIKTNEGLAKQPLNKIASGGELSRIGLAVQMATAEDRSVPTLIFDEVDVGIGGATAEMVGNLIRKLGDTQQVLCVTHLAQVAARCHHHLKVSKHIENNITHTQVTYLNNEDKIIEVARMIGGVNLTPTTVAHAKEMLAVD